MGRVVVCVVSAMAIVIVGQHSEQAAAKDAERPNVVVILADDMGFSDLGCYGGEIATPNLDRLAKGGLRFRQFYNTARCWPTRGALLTGYYAQAIRRDVVPGIPSGGRGKRPAWAKLLPLRLKRLGYRSYHSGKWHVDGKPIENGFDRSYWLRDQGRYFSPKVHYLDDRRLPPVPRNSGFYGTKEVVTRAVSFLKQHNERYADQSFFCYVAFAAPHFPLHALPEDIARYQGRYDGGWEVVRQERWKRVRRFFDGATLSPVERNIGPPYDFPQAFEKLGRDEVKFPLPWKELTPSQRAFQATKMSIHAAMIDRLDLEVGRLLIQLRAMKAWDNTVIFFLSDNGASAEIMVRGDGHDPKAAPGSAATHLCLGPGWSTVANTPFRRHKTWVHEGGIATPLIVHWPSGIADQGAWRDVAGHVVDLVPTILELAVGRNGPSPRTSPNVPFHGTSLAGVIQRNEPLERDYLWWLHEGNRAIRMGDWKLVAAKGYPWELYDLSLDRTETNDVSRAMPQKVESMREQWSIVWREFQRLAGE